MMERTTTRIKGLGGKRGEKGKKRIMQEGNMGDNDSTSQGPGRKERRKREEENSAGKE